MKKQRCSCGKPAHPLYGSSCEDCFAKRQAHMSRRVYDEKSVPMGLDMPICELDINPLSLSALEKGGIIRLKDLIGKTDEEILSINGIGRRGLKQIREALAEEMEGLQVPAE